MIVRRSGRVSLKEYLSGSSGASTDQASRCCPTDNDAVGLAELTGWPVGMPIWQNRTWVWQFGEEVIRHGDSESRPRLGTANARSLASRATSHQLGGTLDQR